MKNFLKRLFTMKTSLLILMLGIAVLAGCGGTCPKEQNKTALVEPEVKTAPKTFEAPTEPSFYCDEDKCYIKE